MKLIAVKCPQCDATIDVDENRKSCFCSFCGTKIIVDDGSRTYTHIHIDKTREKELEFEKMKLEKEREEQYLRFELEKQQKKQKLISDMVPWVSLVLACIFARITFSVIGNESHVWWNYFFMLVPIVLCLLVLVVNKRYHVVTIMSGLIIVSSICFMFLRSNFKSSFGVGVFFVLVSFIIAGVGADN